MNAFTNMASPALSVRSDFSDMNDEELDQYLATCVPFSNLPTPPPAKQPPLSALPSPPSDVDIERCHKSPELAG